MIFDKEKCKQAYEVYPNMGQVIEKYMICTLEVGNIDERGYPVLTEAPINDGCASQKQSALNYPGSSVSGLFLFFIIRLFYFLIRLDLF